MTDDPSGTEDVAGRRMPLLQDAKKVCVFMLCMQVTLISAIRAGTLQVSCFDSGLAFWLVLLHMLFEHPDHSRFAIIASVVISFIILVAVILVAVCFMEAVLCSKDVLKDVRKPYSIQACIVSLHHASTIPQSCRGQLGMVVSHSLP